jgi:hypothetical protein
MQQTTIQGLVRPVVVSNLERTAKNLKEWLGTRSATFSRLCGEDFTRGEVVKAHAVFLLLIVALNVAAWLEGGAL